MYRAEYLSIVSDACGEIQEELGTQIVITNIGYYNRYGEDAKAAVLMHGLRECVALTWQAVNGAIEAMVCSASQCVVYPGYPLLVMHWSDLSAWARAGKPV
jgi:hypothetical protein